LRERHHVVAGARQQPIPFLNDQIGQRRPDLLQSLAAPVVRLDAEPNGGRAIQMTDRAIGAAQQQPSPGSSMK
jgi:hypothetical protein